jgi:FeS cluster assembly scaffold protein NifU
MKSTQYSEKVLDHFRNPRNVGTLEGDDVAVGRVGNPVCGDLMEIYIRVNDNVISEIKFKTFGCGSAIATASMITELAKGKTLDQAFNITRNDVANELNGLPPVKMHCSNLAADALKDAINNYRTGRQPDRTIDISKDAACQKSISGAEAYLDKGVFLKISDTRQFKDKRVLVLDTGMKSIETALQVAEHAPRVIFVTSKKDLNAYAKYKKDVASARIKILYESELLGVSGAKEVEKARIHDQNEDETYELFVDAVITPTQSI